MGRAGSGLGTLWVGTGAGKELRAAGARTGRESAVAVAPPNLGASSRPQGGVGQDHLQSQQDRPAPRAVQTDLQPCHS